MANFLVLLFSMVLTAYTSEGRLPTCQPNDFHYEFTGCDSNGGRWRVSVPEPDKCEGGAPPPPVRGKDCKFTCDAGQFLNMTDQVCNPCPPGTYSLGGGARFDEWDKIPQGFTADVDNFLDSIVPGKDHINCTDTEWKPKGEFIASYPGPCSSNLVYSVTLVQPGSVTFEYQYTDSASMFQFKVQNDQCQSVADQEASSWPGPTKEGEFKQINLVLKTGLNVIIWRTMGLNIGDTKTKYKPVMIRKIEVTGVAYTSECTKCRAGTHSSKEGAQFCTPCDVNTFSERGAAQCNPCDAATLYSRKGASKCLARPVCTDRDYYETQAPCNSEQKTYTEYKWILPQVCRENDDGAVRLPSEGPPRDCPPCNPGHEYVNGVCQVCGDNKYSDGSGLCKLCPASTSPTYGIEYKWWNEMPVNMSSECITFTESECESESRWMVAGGHVHTHYGRGDDAYLILLLKVGGFRTNGASMDGEIARIEFVFETNCTGKCEFIFLSDDTGHSTIINTWEGNQQKTKYKYSIHSADPITFTWAFEHSDWTIEDTDQTREKFVNDVAKIYSIKVTNTLQGGASGCQKCPKGLALNGQSGCVPCPAGHYIDVNDTSCKPCPPNTVIPNGYSWGPESCVKCGDGLRAVEGQRCETDCMYRDQDGREYDFSSLAGPKLIQGSHLFTGTGTQYYHGFNISLCGSRDTMAICRNNVSSSDSKRLKIHQTSAMVCRTTLVPDRDSGTVVSTQPVSVGDSLYKIVSNVSLTDMYLREGYQKDGSENDIHFYFKSEKSTIACVSGRNTIISLRCDPSETKAGTLEMPPKCADGTCDGCDFHFMWRTQSACAVCRKEDAEKIIGECEDGVQLVHFTPPANCVLKSKLETEKQACTVKLSALPFALQVAIPIAAAFSLLMLLVVMYCWHKNRGLEVKYMKLAENSDRNYDGELPGVDSCALEDGEDDQYDSVTFKESRGARFFKKLRGKRGKDDENPFEPSNGEKIPLT
ncbi:UPF0577 protein KIAA1324-like homolog isoform X2 [Mizuhopecten yessoensis]|uniref:MRH domain-containing protein n=1 Tax=Mizuhopecten yessoensis TaxID=6573 RepID=A0A210QZR9_MIZYE|nr:UPF0577 protein KIAA1324-like homolog isoform X2 [Mizuhopecten yessoensis]OWF54250.1 hypothetical protein KP79_PYT10923 [Mizuhopecten yessoensis]